MEAIYKNYAIIASNWVPKNFIDSFLPFFKNYIVTEKINYIKIEGIISGLKRVYSIDFSYQLVTAILNRLKSTNEVKIENNKYIFSIKNPELYNSFSSDITSEINQLIYAFKNYCISNKYEDINYEKELNNFFKNYDYELMLYANNEEEHNETDITKLEKSCNNRLVAKFIEYCKEHDSSVYKTIIKISEGNLVKSAIYFDKITDQYLKNKKFFIDTKIVLRIMGFNDSFLQKQYLNFVKRIILMGGEVWVSSFVFEEIRSILYFSELHIKNFDYDYSKASEVLLHFIEHDFNVDDIQDIIARLDVILENEYGLKVEHNSMDIIENCDNYADLFCSINELIKKAYNYVTDDDYDDYESEFSSRKIETDCNSIIHSFSYTNFKINQFKDGKGYFVTTNKTLVKVAHEFFSSKNYKSIVPVINDYYLGLITSTSIEELNDFSELKLTAFCINCHKPSFEQKRKFIEKVEKLRDEGGLTEENYYLLKYSSGFDRAFSEECTNNDLIPEPKSVVKRLLDESNEMTKKQYEERILKIKEENSSKLDFKDIEKRQALDEKNEHIINLANKEINRSVFISKIFIYIVFYLIVLTSFVINLVYSIKTSDRSALFWTSVSFDIILALINVLPLVFNKFTNEFIENKILSKYIINVKIKVFTKYKNALGDDKYNLIINAIKDNKNK